MNFMSIWLANFSSFSSTLSYSHYYWNTKRLFVLSNEKGINSYYFQGVALDSERREGEKDRK